jgi:hypothetical protein
MRWIWLLLRRYSEDARFRFILGVAMAILVLVVSAIRWG